MSLYFSKVVCKFLQLSTTTVHWSVTGKRVNRFVRYGLTGNSCNLHALRAAEGNGE